MSSLITSGSTVGNHGSSNATTRSPPIAAAGSNGTNTIQLDTMSLDQLNTLKQREEQRLQALSQRYSALRQAAARINAAKHAVQELYGATTTTTTTTTTATTTGVVVNNNNNTKETDGNNETKDHNNDNSDEPSSVSAVTNTTIIALATTKDVFVPLTESVYVPGKIRIRTAQQPPQPQEEKQLLDEELLLIELGTGYFVEQNSTATIDYLQRKLNLVDANSDNVTQAIQATRQNMESIAIAMRGKLIEIQARQQGQRTQQQHMEAIAEEN